MPAVKIYGIKNCDTMKKAFGWLGDKGISYDFHDYKKDGVDMDILAQAISSHGWEEVINRRGTTWRNLPDEIKAHMNGQSAIEIANENPSIIKRPLLVVGDKTHLGFSADEYTQLLA